jgi:hypothetical protein
LDAQALLLSGVLTGGPEGKEQLRDRLATMVREEIDVNTVNQHLMNAVNKVLQGQA